MAGQIDIVLNAINKASGPLGDVSASLSKLEGISSSLLKRGLGPLQSALSDGLRISTNVAVSGMKTLFGTLSDSIGGAADFQQSMGDIQASMGASAEDTNKLKKLILDLGIDPKLKVSAEEAAQAIGQLGTAGVSIDDILKGTARSTVLLANATGADFANAASIASDVSKLWNIDAGNLKGAIDGITATTVASKFNIEDYRLALAQAGGVAATVGVGFEDFNTSIAAISPFFASGSDAGTSFKVMLQNLIPKSDKTKDEMKKLGLITTDYAAAAKRMAEILGHEVEPNIAGVNSAAAEWIEKSSGMKVGTNENAKAASKFVSAFGQNQFYDANGNLKDMAAIVQVLHDKLGNLSEKELNKALHEVFGTVAMRAAAAMVKMTASDFTNLQNVMAKTDSAESAKTRMDTLRGSLEILSGTFDTLKLMIGEKFLPTINDLVKRFNDFLSNSAPMIVDWVGLFTEKLSNLVGLYLPVLISKFNEWWAIGQGLVAQIPALVGYVMGLINSIHAMVQPAIDFISRFVTMSDVLNGLKLVLGAIVTGAIASFIAVWGPVALVIGGAIAIVSTLRNEWQNNFMNIQGIVATVTGYLQSRFGQLWEFLRAFGGGALGEIITWVMGNQTQFTNLGRIWDQAKITALALFNDISVYVRNALPGWIAQLTTWGNAAWQWIVGVAPLVLAKLTEWGNVVLGFVAARLPGWIAQLTVWGNAAWQWIMDAMPTIMSKLTEWGNALYGWLIANLPNWVAKLAAWGASLWQWIVNEAPIMTAKLVEWANNLYVWLSSNLPTWMGKLATWGAGLWQWIVDAMPGALLKLGEWASGIFAWVVARLPSWLATFMTWATAMWKWIGDAIPAAINKLTEWVNSMSTWASSGEGNSKLLEMFGTMAATMLTALAKIGIALAKLALVVALNLIVALGNGLLNWLGIDASLTSMKDHLVSAIMGWKPSFNSSGASVMGGMREGFLSAQNALRNGFDLVMDFVQQGRNERLPPFAQSLFDAGSGAINKMGQGFSAVKGAVVDQFNQVMTDVQNQGLAFAGGALLGRMYEGGRSFILKMGEGLNSAAPSLKGNLTGVFQGFLDNFNWWHDNLAPHFLGSAKSLGSAISAGISNIDLRGGLTDAFQALLDDYNWWHDNLAPHFFASAKDLASRLIGGLTQGIRDGIGYVLGAMQEITDALPQWVKDKLGIHSPSTVFAGFGRNLIEGLTQGMQDLATRPQMALSGITDTLQSTLGNVQLGGLGGNNSTISNSQSTTHNWNVSIPTAGGDAPQGQMQSLFNTLTNVYAT